MFGTRIVTKIRKWGPKFRGKHTDNSIPKRSQSDDLFFVLKQRRVTNEDC